MTSLDWVDGWRWLAASGMVITYLLFTFYQYRQSRRGKHFMIRSASRDRRAATGNLKQPIWVIYASQSGQAEAIARQTAAALATDEQEVCLCRIDENWLPEIAQARCVLFVVSTYGEGSAPDHALRFVRNTIAAGPNDACQDMRYGLLALGDRSYPAFCAFGRQLDAWLQTSGATPEFDRIEANQLDSASLLAWRQNLSELVGANRVPTWSSLTPMYTSWQLVERRRLNAGSPGNPVFLVAFQTLDGMPVTWQAGDLVDVVVPTGDGLARTYSIANLPDDGRIELIVRLHIRADGSLGQASAWMTAQAALGDIVSLSVRSHPSFQLAHQQLQPLILIGTGVGIAGLRAHMQARAKAVQDCALAAPQRNAWLFFGERSGKHDYLCQSEIEAWQRTQLLSKLDLSFSRDEPLTPYVQHRLLAASAEVCDWVEHGAHILICGNAQTMAPAVDAALRQILGSEHVDMLLEWGRIQRDVF